jgi:hypothetical protein
MQDAVSSKQSGSSANGQRFQGNFWMMEEGSTAPPVADPLIDLSGERVCARANLLDVVYEPRNQSKHTRDTACLFQLEHFNNEHRRAVVDALALNHRRKGSHPAACRFQQIYVRAFWEGSDAVAKVLITCALLEDETMNKGMP